jgi:hypothetical protein
VGYISRPEFLGLKNGAYIITTPNGTINTVGPIYHKGNTYKFKDYGNNDVMVNDSGVTIQTLTW